MKNVKLLLLALWMLPVFAQAQKQKTPAAKAATKAAATVTKVRGVSFGDFKNSVTDFKDSSKAALADSAWTLWKTEQWAKLEQLFTENGLNGGWPPNRGAASLKIVTLQPGADIDRYGGYYDADSVFQDKGTFVSMKDVPFEKRALPDKTLQSPYRMYRIVKPIPGAREGLIIPWFGKVGLGIQYELPYTINELKAEGYIKQVE